MINHFTEYFNDAFISVSSELYFYVGSHCRKILKWSTSLLCASTFYLSVVSLCLLLEMQLEFLAKFLLYSVQFSSPTSRGMCICSSECSAVYPFGNGFII